MNTIELLKIEINEIIVTLIEWKINNKNQEEDSK